MTTEPALEPLNRFVGSWVTEATHPALPNVVVHGTASFEWLEGQRFLILRSRNDHPDFPDSISIIGFTDVDRAGADAGASAASSGSRLCMHYFDSRGVFRVYEVNVDGTTVLIATHDRKLVASAPGRVLTLDRGRLRSS